MYVLAAAQSKARLYVTREEKKKREDNCVRARELFLGSLTDKTVVKSLTEQVRRWIYIIFLVLLPALFCNLSRGTKGSN